MLLFIQCTCTGKSGPGINLRICHCLQLRYQLQKRPVLFNGFDIQFHVNSDQFINCRYLPFFEQPFPFLMLNLHFMGLKKSLSKSCQNHWLFLSAMQIAKKQPHPSLPFLFWCFCNQNRIFINTGQPPCFSPAVPGFYPVFPFMRICQNDPLETIILHGSGQHFHFRFTVYFKIIRIIFQHVIFQIPYLLFYFVWKFIYIRFIRYLLLEIF